MSTSTSANYHHGDLRQALVAAALAALEGGESPGLRELARRVGVSPSAPYRHFADLGALQQAVAAAGFARFLAALEGAKAEAPPEEQLTAMAEAYVRFALGAPRLFRLMFSSGLGPYADPALRRNADAAYASLAVMAAREDPDAPGEAAISLWAFAHGLAMLLLDGQLLGVSPTSADPLIRALARRHVDGLRRSRTP